MLIEKTITVLGMLLSSDHSQLNPDWWPTEGDSMYCQCHLLKLTCTLCCSIIYISTTFPTFQQISFWYSDGMEEDASVMRWNKYIRMSYDGEAAALRVDNNLALLIVTEDTWQNRQSKICISQNEKSLSSWSALLTGMGDHATPRLTISNSMY